MRSSCSHFWQVAWVLTRKPLMARYDSGFVSALVQIVGTVMLIAWVVPTAGLPPFDLPLRVWLIVGALLGVIVLGEHLGWTGVLGGVLIVGAAVAVTRR